MNFRINSLWARFWMVVAVLGSLMMASSCSSDDDSDDPQPTNQNPTDTTQTDTTKNDTVVPCYTGTISFRNHVQPILTANCMPCHDAATLNGEVHLENYVGAAAAAREKNLLGSVRHDAGAIPMPNELLKLDSCQIVKIEDWVAAGLPDN